MTRAGVSLALLAALAALGTGLLGPAAAGTPRANLWQPLTPGLQSVARGFVNAGSRRLPHTRVYTVTDVVKVINGVRSVAVLDQDIDGGQIVEQAIDYLSIDAKGTVWYRGSYTEGYEGGRFGERPGRLAGRPSGREGGHLHAGQAARRLALVLPAAGSRVRRPRRRRSSRPTRRSACPSAASGTSS